MKKLLLSVAIMAIFVTKLSAEGLQDSDTTSMTILVEELEIKSIKQDRSFNMMPLSATTIGVGTMKNNSVESVTDLTSVIPNLFISDYGVNSSTSAYIRGVGSRLSPSVGLYVDGMPYFGKATFDFDFSGIESIEVLRGPQATLYGRNSLGGVINIYTKSPFKNDGTDIRLRGGSYGTYDASVDHYGSTKNEKLGYGISANYAHKDGFFENTYTGSRADKGDQGSARLKLSYNISDSLSIDFMGSVDILSQLGFAYTPYDAETGELSDISYNAPSTYDRVIGTASMAVKYNHEKFKLLSQTSFLYSDDEQGIDQDFTSQDLVYVVQHQKQSTVSEEINLKGSVGRRYSWLVGAFGFYQNQFNDVAVEYRYNSSETLKKYDLPTYGAAIYHQSTLHNIFVNGLDATVGIRFDYENGALGYNYDYYSGGAWDYGVMTLDQKRDFNSFMPKFALQYLTGSSNIYANVSRGYKSGGYNTSFNGTENIFYNPEKNWNYELGYKHSCWDNRVRTEIALFYIDWKDQQVYKRLDEGVMLTNAGHSVSKGAEISIYVRPIRSLNIRLNYGYTSAKFEDYLYQEGVDYSGNYLPYVPRNTFGVNADYTLYTDCFIDNIVFGASYNAQGDIYWDDENLIKESFYGIFNGRIAVSKGSYTLELWGRNMLNTQYFGYQFYSSFGQTNLVQLGNPATFGATLSMSF